MSDFANRISQLIKDRGIQKQELANAVGYTPQTVSRWCNGHMTPDTHTLEKLADYFRVSTDYLLGKTDFPNKTNNDPYYLDKLSKEVKLSQAVWDILESIGCSVQIQKLPSTGIRKVRNNEFCVEYKAGGEIRYLITQSDGSQICITESEWQCINSSVQEHLKYQIWNLSQIKRKE